ncbi:MAG: TetR family transcriptional regulator [Tepidamorphaceae bacterium]
MAPSKTAKAGSEDSRDAIIDAAMALAQDNDWEAIRLSDIAAEAGVTMAQLRGAFDSKTAIINGLMRRIDQVVLEGDDPEMAGEPARDRLFDVLMRRFDALKPYRLALKSIMRAYRRDPFAAAAFNMRARRSMKWMLEAAGIEATGRMGNIRAQGLVFVMARTMPVFLRDKDAGLARTMAALDRALRDGEQVMRTMGTGMRMLGMFGSFVSGLRDRARDRFDDEDDDDGFYGPDDDEAKDEPWTGGPH